MQVNPTTLANLNKPVTEQSKPTQIRDSQGVISGDHAVQNNDFSQHIHHHHYHERPSKPTKNYERYIKLDLAAAYYDRKHISSKLEFEFADSLVSSVFLVGHYEDWHEGMWNRLTAHYERQTTSRKNFAKINWPEDNDSAKLWYDTCKSFGIDHAFKSEEESKNLIAQYLTEQHRSSRATQLLIRFKLEDMPLSHCCEKTIKATIAYWKSLHSLLKNSGSDEVHIDLIFTVIDEIAFTDKLKRSFGIRSNRSLKQISTWFPEALSAQLPLVNKRDVDDWINKMRHLFEAEIQHEAWWLELETQMRRQFDLHKKDLHLKTLRDQLAEDPNFRRALKYPH